MLGRRQARMPVATWEERERVCRGWDRELVHDGLGTGF